jgi:hypothetical protein
MPHVSIAALCERVLTEKDNVLSLIRLVDTFTPESLPQNANLPQNTPLKFVPVAHFVVVVILKSGEAKGKYQVALRLQGPSGKQQPLGDAVPFVFEGGEQGASLLADVTIPADQPGLAWIDVLVDDEALTRIPFRIRPRSEDESPLPPRSKSHESEARSAAPESRE